METKYRFSITGSTLKLIAIILMVIDHVGAVIFEQGLLQTTYVTSNPELFRQLASVDWVLRQIGRPAFPIFCFLLVEGYTHTQNVKKYAGRLAVFALISEIPFDLAITGNYFDFRFQNIYFTLLIGLLVMAGVTYFHKNVIFQGLILVLGLAAGHFLKCDYGAMGVLLIELLFLFRHDRRYQTIGGMVAVYYEPAAFFAYPFILLYHGERGRQMKYLFYWFYPAHLLLFGVLTMLISMYRL